MELLNDESGSDDDSLDFTESFEKYISYRFLNKFVYVFHLVDT